MPNHIVSARFLRFVLLLKAHHVSYFGEAVQDTSNFLGHFLSLDAPLHLPRTSYHELRPKHQKKLAAKIKAAELLVIR